MSAASTSVDSSRDDPSGASPAADAAFLTELSHEIRNPLNGIVAMVDLLIGSDLTPDQMQCAQTILTSAETLVGTADSLLGRLRPQADAPSATPTKPSGTARVLVAEDNATNQLVVRSLLERLGHECTIVENGRLAVDAVTADHYDLILMDCMMPELDGFDATREIRALESDVATIPIIALTANAMKGDREKCLNAGMDEYMAKPVRRDLLAEMIERFRPGGALS